MTLTNCSSCGKQIDTDVHPKTPEGHMCFDCHFDYVISKGVGYAVNLSTKGGYRNFYL